MEYRPLKKEEVERYLNIGRHYVRSKTDGVVFEIQALKTDCVFLPLFSNGISYEELMKSFVWEDDRSEIGMLS